MEWRAEITVATLCQEMHGFEMSLDALRDAIERVVTETPDEVRDTLKLSVATDTEWDSPRATLTIQRQETEAEARERKKQEDALREAGWRLHWANKRAEYERLKALFEPPPPQE